MSCFEERVVAVWGIVVAVRDIALRRSIQVPVVATSPAF